MAAATVLSRRGGAAASGHVAATAPSDPAVAALLRALTGEMFQQRPRDADDSDHWDPG